MVPIIDDAHLPPHDALRKLRLLLEDFPENHGFILFGLPFHNTTLQLSINHGIRSRITYSAKIDPLAPHTITGFVRSQLDRVGLPHQTFTEAAINLIIRSSEGALRTVKNLCIGALIETLHYLTKSFDLKQVNAILLQPHWQHNQQSEPAHQGIVFTNQPPFPKVSNNATLKTKNFPVKRRPALRAHNRAKG